VLLEFYPQALQAFPNLKHKAALSVLAAGRDLEPIGGGRVNGVDTLPEVSSP
jgi:hypothetical protein